MADNFNLRSFLTENKLTKNAQLVAEAQFSDSYDTPAAKAVNAKANQIVKTITGYKTALQTIQDAIKQVEQEVGSEVTRSEKSTLERHLMHMFRSSMEMEREGVENDEPVMEEEDKKSEEDTNTDDDFILFPLDVAKGRKYVDGGVWREKDKSTMKETKLTAKERRLVEMVQDALDTEGYGTDNINLQRKKQGLPPAQGPKYSEGISEEEMVQENPLPKYNSIEELMKEIEHGTNEAAHTYKMNRMKEVAEMLEAKVGSLEEGEHAEHIDQKAVKQMRKDIAALRKAEEKLRKEFDKKFNKKEKAAAAPKAEKVEALQEGTFDLRKFLAENKITSNSRLLKEDRMQAMDIPRKYTEAIVDAKNALNLLRDVVMAGTLMDREMEETFQFTVTLLDMLEEKIQGRRERF